MSQSSSAKHAPWLANQISIARRNLSEWPDWMKEAARFDGTGAIKGTTQDGSSGKSSPSQRTRKTRR